jgi:alpha-tubulin suppressor-like RCC1 family protein
LVAIVPTVAIASPAQSGTPGSVWAWGINANGQLGNGSTTDSSVPVQVSNLSAVVAVSGGTFHALALKSDGTVWAWGSNLNGQLGNGTNTSTTTPVQVSNLSGISAISAGSTHSLALRFDGTVWAWGNNFDGQLGVGSDINSNVPLQVTGLSGVTAIAAGAYDSLALKSDGTVWSWGDDQFGQLGTGTTILFSTVPVQVVQLSNATHLGSGYYQSFVVKSDTTLWGWGYNNIGQLGSGNVTNVRFPVPTIQANGATVSSTVAVTSGAFFGLALRRDGTVLAWGDDSSGQLGNGSTHGSRLRATRIAGLPAASGIAAGQVHGLVLGTDGSVWAWGSNSNGQLGNGTTVDSSVPAPVSNLTGATGLGGSIGNFSLAIVP